MDGDVCDDIEKMVDTAREAVDNALLVSKKVLEVSPLRASDTTVTNTEPMAASRSPARSPRSPGGPVLGRRLSQAAHVSNGYFY